MMMRRTTSHDHIIIGSKGQSKGMARHSMKTKKSTKAIKKSTETEKDRWRRYRKNDADGIKFVGQHIEVLFIEYLLTEATGFLPPGDYSTSELKIAYLAFREVEFAKLRPAYDRWRGLPAKVLWARSVLSGTLALVADATIIPAATRGANENSPVVSPPAWANTINRRCSRHLSATSFASWSRRSAPSSSGD
jgi:hypothetical protein